MLQRTKNVLIAGLSALIIFSLPAQAVTPSPQMIEQFKQLPASEQQRIAQQYGIDPSILGSSSKTQTISAPSVIEPRKVVNTVVDQSEDEVLNQATKTEAKTEAVETKKEKQLQRFGYDLFAGEPTTFAPVSDVPVPSKYMVGPGDTLNVQLYGKNSKEFTLTINREGVIQFPDLGPISLNGLTFAEVREVLKRRIDESMIGIQASITMGELRSIRIFIAGDAYKPGSYTVSSLSTITQALFVSGGINDIGSLRNIQLKRSGKTVGTLDLYDLLMRGDASGDKRLQSGDVVFVPPSGSTVGVKGEIRRPAIYELKNNETMADVLAMASGLNPGAYPKASTVERYVRNASKTVISVDLTTSKGLKTKVHNGDLLSVKSASSRVDNAITIAGAVIRPGQYQWHENLKVADLLPSIWGDLTIAADLDYALLVREVNQRGDIDVFHVEIGRAISQPQSIANIALSPRDRLLVFDYDDRSELLAPILKKLKGQVKFGQPEKVVTINGNVRFAGQYPLTSNADIKDLVIAAGGLKEKLEYTLLVREKNNRGDIEVEKVSLESVTANPSALQTSQRIKLKHRDTLFVFDYSDRSELLEPVIKKLKNQSRKGEAANVVSILGNVRFPGEYPLTKSADIQELLLAAGGLTEGAYTLTAELTRQNISAELGVEFVHKQLNLQDVLLKKQGANIVLQSRDTVTIRTLPSWQEAQWVTLKGEVKFPGTYSIQHGESLKQVLDRAGGLTEDAAPKSSVFLRKSIQRKEQVEISKLSDQLRRDIAARALTKDGAVIGFADSQLMLKELENVKTVGRLVIDINAVNMGIEAANINLETEDELYVPAKNQIVSVMGEVQFPSTHRFKEGITFDQYLLMAGGPRKRADDDRAYIIKADGSVAMENESHWFSNSNQIEPGDTIIVPLDTEYKDNLTLWQQVTTIIYNSAIAVAAVATL